MSPAARLALTVLVALTAAAITVAVATLVQPTGPLVAIALPLVLLGAALVVRWR